MFRPRVIPCLLLRDGGLVKTKKFKNDVYVGDPVNAVRIFSAKEADELIFLDIDASRKGQEPDYSLIAEIAGECFMPVAYGGGVRTLEQARKVIRSGVEKIVINSQACEDMSVITEISRVFGNQAVVGAIDVKKGLLGGYKVVAKSASVETRLDLVEHAQNLVSAGAGEILVNNVDRDGTMKGFDLDLLKLLSESISTPLIACGGAGTLEHLTAAIQEGRASAVAAGSMLVFHGKRNAVLINYPREFVF